MKLEDTSLRYLYKRRLLIALLSIWIILSALILPYSNSPEFISEEGIPGLQLFKYNTNAISIILPKKQYQDNIGFDCHVNVIFSVFPAWKLILVLQLTLLVLIIDKRNYIIALIISHFVGSKYKDSFPV
jgi:hypothetical protein